MPSDRDDGGAAFANRYGEGMLLRDYFAAAGLNGVMTSATGLVTLEESELRKMFDDVARILYMAADAMIAARKSESSQ